MFADHASYGSVGSGSDVQGVSPRRRHSLRVVVAIALALAATAGCSLLVRQRSQETVARATALENAARTPSADDDGAAEQSQPSPAPEPATDDDGAAEPSQPSPAPEPAPAPANGHDDDDHHQHHDDDGASSLSASNVNVTCDGYDAELVCGFVFTLSGGGDDDQQVDVTIEYAPAGAAGVNMTLWTRVLTKTADGSTTHVVDLFRLRAKQHYTATLYARASASGDDGAAATALASATFHSPSFACGDAFDGASPYASEVKGAPGWGLLFTSATVCLPTWQGVVALDAEGYVVWGYGSATTAVCTFYVFEVGRRVAADVSRCVVAAIGCRDSMLQ